jgi:hypothetical protein
MHENEPGGGAPPDEGPRRLTYRCTDCEHWFSSHGDVGCERTSDETNERCACTRKKEALFASYGPPFPPLTVRGRYARHLRRYRVRNDPWQVAMRPVFAALRARRQDGRLFIPPWLPLIG